MLNKLSIKVKLLLSFLLVGMIPMIVVVLIRRFRTLLKAEFSSTSRREIVGRFKV